MYVSIWCKHGHIFFILVSFLAKESNNLALMMATFIEPPFGAVPMTPNPSTMWFMSFAVLLSYVGVLPCCTMEAQNVCSKRLGTPWMFCLALFASPLHLGPYELCPPGDTLRHVYPLFLSWVDYLKGGLTKTHHPHWTPLMNASPNAPAFHSVWELFFFPFVFF
jgi:CDP-diglyceride synthetase